MFRNAWAYSGSVSSGQDLIEIMRNVLGVADNMEIVLFKFDVQTDQKITVNYGPSGFHGTLADGSGNYTLRLQSGKEGVSSHIEKLVFSEACNVIMFNCEYNIIPIARRSFGSPTSDKKGNISWGDSTGSGALIWEGGNIIWLKF